MVKHIILWNLKDEFSNKQKLEMARQEFSSSLSPEALKESGIGQIPRGR